VRTLLERQQRALVAQAYRQQVTSRARQRQAAHLLRPSPATTARFTRDLVTVMRAVHAGVRSAMGITAGAGGDEVRTSRADAVKVLPPQAERRMFAYVREHVGPAFDRMGKAVDANSKEGNALIGIQPASVPGLGAIFSGAREASIARMQDAASTYAKQVEGVLRDPKNVGLRVEELAEQLEERGKVSASRAVFIARDQTLRTNALVNRARHEAAGVTRYRWSTSRDERVRPRHAELEGDSFDYDDPPVTNDAGDRNNPGEDYQCRCIPLPIIAELEPPEEEEPPPSGPRAAQPGEEEEEPTPAATGKLDPAASFSSVTEDPSARFSAADIINGVDHEGLADWLKDPANQPSLTVHAALPPPAKQTWEGYYRTSTGEIVMKANVPAPTAIELTKTWGDTWRVADRGRAVKNARGFVTGFAKTVEEKVQDSFIHELGHHVHLNAKGHFATRARVNNLISDAYDRTGLSKPGAAKKVLDGHVPSPAVSRYAATDHQEYFAESFNAYMTEPAGLKAHDPNGFRMVEDVLDALKIKR